MAESHPCPKCGHPVEHTHGAVGRPPWCFCRSCGTMFNPEHTDTPPLPLTNTEPVQEDTVTTPAETPAAEPAKPAREVKHRPDPNTPFTDDDLSKLPNWAQGKVRYLNAQLVAVLEQLAAVPTSQPTLPLSGHTVDVPDSTPPADGEAQPAEGDTPLGLTVSEDGDLLNWQGENYVRQGELVAVRYTAAARLARLAELVSEGLEELPELEDDNDE